MKKDPSIHIKRSDFKKILRKLEVKGFPTAEFFKLAADKAVNSRIVVVSNKQVDKQVKKILLATKGDANLAADILYSVRIKLGHRGIRKISQFNVRDWDFCKKLAEVCNSFCEEFGFENIREGFITYMEIGIKITTSSRNLLTKLISMSEVITEYYGTLLDLKEDTKPRVTKSIHDYYVRCIASNTGITENYTDQPAKYIHFFNLRKFLEEKDWGYEGFIDAQFEALSFCNGIPPLETLYGDKAIERYNKWLYKNSATTSIPRVSGSLWDSIKDK
jgi:hypothetical protein